MEVSMVGNLFLTILFMLSLLPASPLRNPPTNSAPGASVHIPLEGARIFETQCASCHGSDGRGHGPASAVLKEQLEDLTLILKRNGGKYPEQRVKDFIEGKQPGPLAQGSREMPIWGPIFHQVEADQDWGEVRLAAVTKYLESIQQK
jgi:mono/diheme cytochrome c family protein